MRAVRAGRYSTLGPNGADDGGGTSGQSLARGSSRIPAGRRTSGRQSMKTRAAVLRDMGEDWEKAIEMDLDPPQGERGASGSRRPASATRTTTCAPVTSGRYPIVGGHEGGRGGRGGRHRREPGATGRPHRLLVPADLRALPVLRQRHDQPVRPRRAVRGQLPAGGPSGSTPTARTSARCACWARSPSARWCPRALAH